MAKSSYIGGIDNKARKIKKGYLGDIDSKAQKVKKAYIGVNGVARPFFASGISYYGQAPDLSSARLAMAAASVGGYALFAGGYTLQAAGTGYTSVQSGVVDAYDEALVRSSPVTISARSEMQGVSFGKYAVFSFSRNNSVINFIDSAFVNKTLTGYGCSLIGAATVGDNEYVMFTGGFNNATQKTVQCISAALVSSSSLSLGTARYRHAGASVGGYALFAGGMNDVTSHMSSVEVFSPELVKSSATSLYTATKNLSGASFGDYALFGGGRASGGTLVTVTAYNSELVKCQVPDLSSGRSFIATAVLQDHALFGGGSSNGSDDGAAGVVDIYNEDLVHSVAEQGLASPTMYPAATTIGNYALFAGADGAVTAYTI
ncbi:MAG: hypothetical protein E7478_07200 [Ruminococcaceae bacterium]|nr:hypothetical protein [Oscillospiraceae bacterium]